MTTKTRNQNRSGVKIWLRNSRLAWPNVFSPRTVQNDDGSTRQRFDATFIITPDSEAFKAVQKAIIEAAKQRWKEDGLKIAQLLLKRDQTCLHDGEEKALQYDGFEGNWYVSASNRRRPTVVHKYADPATGKAQVLTEADGVIYAGCYVHGLIEVYAMEARGSIKRGIHATLLGLQFADDGDAFGGKVASADDFDAIDAPPEGADAPWTEDEASLLA